MTEHDTIYQVIIVHEDAGRRAVIFEDGPEGGEVANFICDEMDEYDWLERFGKTPRRAYRHKTIDTDPEAPTITWHNNYLLTARTRDRPESRI